MFKIGDRVYNTVTKNYKLGTVVGVSSKRPRSCVLAIKWDNSTELGYFSICGRLYLTDILPTIRKATRLDLFLEGIDTENKPGYAEHKEIEND